MRGLLGISTACILISAVATGHAADLPVKAKPLPAPPFSFAGWYVGLNAGALWDDPHLGNGNFALEPLVFSDLAGAFTGVPVGIVIVPGTFPLPVAYNRTGNNVAFVGGGQAGYNWQTGRTVYGVEADVQGTNASSNYTATFAQTFAGAVAAGNVSRSLTAETSIQRDWQASFRGRIGYAWDRLLMYGTGGVAVSSLSARTTFTATTTLGAALAPIPGLANPTGTTTNIDRQTIVGGTIGAGFEYALTNAWLAGGEYRYTYYGHQLIGVGATPAGAVPSTPASSVSANLDSHQITARISYLFNRN